ncbi:hypothetical protein ACW185_00840 [Limosilactobacillus fermentum]
METKQKEVMIERIPMEARHTNWWDMLPPGWGPTPTTGLGLSVGCSPPAVLPSP